MAIPQEIRYEGTKHIVLKMILAFSGQAYD